MPKQEAFKAEVGRLLWKKPYKIFFCRPRVYKISRQKSRICKFCQQKRCICKFSRQKRRICKYCWNLPESMKPFGKSSLKAFFKARKPRQNVNSRQNSKCWGRAYLSWTTGPADPQLLPPCSKVKMFLTSPLDYPLISATLSLTHWLTLCRKTQ